jgi:ubiquitin-protein ligase
MACLAIRRSTRETSKVQSSEELKKMGVYYRVNEDNAMKGTAMLVGKEGTPYAGGFYFFDIEFPNDYPYAPLKVKTLTQDGRTRFNPNLYTCGKVCLSILNTWSGPSWNVTQTLETVLLSIMSMVLNENPIANEPGYESKINTDTSHTYNRIIFHANVKTAILDMLKSTPKFAVQFKDEMEKEFEKNKSIIQKALEDQLSHDGEEVTGSMYSLSCKFQFKSLLAKINGTEDLTDSSPLIKKESSLPDLPTIPKSSELKVEPEKTKVKTKLVLPSVSNLLSKKNQEELSTSKTVSAPSSGTKKEEFPELPPITGIPGFGEFPSIPSLPTLPKYIKLANHPGLKSGHLKADNEDLTNIIFKLVDRKKPEIVAIGKYIKLSEVPVSPDYENFIEKLTEEEIKAVRFYGIDYKLILRLPSYF